MIKNLLTTAAVIIACSMNAQTGKKINNPTKDQFIFNSSTALQTVKTATQTCDSIVTIAQTATISVGTAGSDTATPGCSPKAGYVVGTNCYDDREKANFNDGTLYGSISNLSVTAVRTLFYKSGTEGTQGAPTATVGMKIYSGSLAGGPTTNLGSVVKTMAAVLSTSTTQNFFFHQFNFLTPIQVPSTGFYASLVLPTNVAGDTAVIASEVQPTANLAWEKFNDNTWHAFTATNSWQTNGNLYLIPKYCFNVSGVGISKNMGISENVVVYPNPSNGVINVTTTFLSKENIIVTVTNALGKVIATASKSTILVDHMSFDMSNEANGVYFVTVSNGTDKMVSRIVLTK